MILGAHMSIAGGVDKAIERGASIDCDAIQIFVKNNNQWFAKEQTKEEIERFKKLQKETNIFVFAHTGYLINLASPKEDVYEKSMESMLGEIIRCQKLDIPYLVLHPGSHLGTGEETGIKKIIKSLNKLFKETKKSTVKVLLETTSGQGTNLGYKFEHISEIIAGISEKTRTGVCFDTCHSFSAGYDIKSKDGYKKTMEEFDKIIGIKNLLAFHINDSKFPMGQKKDRHEHIGQGFLGLEAFENILNDKRFKNIPMVLETPKDEDLKEDVENLKTLRSLIH